MTDEDLPVHNEGCPLTDAPHGNSFKLQTLNKKYLLSIPIGVVVLLGFFVSPWTLDTLKSILATLNGGSLNGAEYFSVAFALVGGFIMLLLALSFLPDYDRTRLALMLEMAGAGIGWVLGMFLSPTSQSEQQTFLSAKTAIVGIVSGYVLSKLQSAFEKAIAAGSLLNLTSLAFGLVFFIPLLLSTAAIYNVRAYQDLNVKISFKLSDVKRILRTGSRHIRLNLIRVRNFWQRREFRTIPLCFGVSILLMAMELSIKTPASTSHHPLCRTIPPSTSWR